jgi:hypothetical protein
MGPPIDLGGEKLTQIMPQATGFASMGPPIDLGGETEERA